MQNRRPAKLVRWQVQLLIWSGSLLWSTGGIWLFLHHFYRVKGEFGPEANPLEPWMLRLHGLAMIVSLVGVGSLLVAHVWKGWSYRHQRVMGSLMTGIVGILVLSGYLLYYVGNEEVREWISLGHWLVGLLLPAIFILHYRRGHRIVQSTPASARRSEAAPISGDG